MSEVLPQQIHDQMALARRTQQRRRSKLKLRVAGREVVVLRYWEDGFALDAKDARGLRGLVDLYDTGKHVCQALIVASSETDGERRFEVKSAIPATPTAPPADFVRERPEIAGLLTRH